MAALYNGTNGLPRGQPEAYSPFGACSSSTLSRSELCRNLKCLKEKADQSSLLDKLAPAFLDIHRVFVEQDKLMRSITDKMNQICEKLPTNIRFDPPDDKTKQRLLNFAAEVRAYIASRRESPGANAQSKDRVPNGFANGSCSSQKSNGSSSLSLKRRGVSGVPSPTRFPKRGHLLYTSNQNAAMPTIANAPQDILPTNQPSSSKDNSSNANFPLPSTNGHILPSRNISGSQSPEVVVLSDDEETPDATTERESEATKSEPSGHFDTSYSNGASSRAGSAPAKHSQSSPTLYAMLSKPPASEMTANFCIENKPISVRSSGKPGTCDLYILSGVGRQYYSMNPINFGQRPILHPLPFPESTSRVLRNIRASSVHSIIVKIISFEEGKCTLKIKVAYGAELANERTRIYLAYYLDNSTSVDKVVEWEEQGPYMGDETGTKSIQMELPEINKDEILVVSCRLGTEEGPTSAYTIPMAVALGRSFPDQSEHRAEFSLPGNESVERQPSPDIISID